MPTEMMETFIRKITDEICKITGGRPKFEDVMVVLPNRRAHRKLLDELAGRFKGETFFAPAVFPMDDFVSFLSPLKNIDNTTLMLRLHQATRDIQNERCELENLQSWCAPFLRDINDMDMQLQDVRSILETYADSAKFEVSLGKDEMSESDRKKIMFNELLSEIYVRFRELLLENSEAYTGMQYRDCAGNIEEYAVAIAQKHIVFAGFYALSPSELKIMKYVKENFHTNIFFDADPFYCHINESGGIDARRQTSFFLKRDCEYLGLDIGGISFRSNSFREQEKDIRIVSTSKKMRQVYAAIDAVRELAAEKHPDYANDGNSAVDMSDTALVLADESLLVPFLSSYNIENVPYNVTMGIPFKTTPFYALLQSVVSLYENALLLTPEEKSELLFSGVDVSLLFESEYLKGYGDGLPECFAAKVAAAQMPHKELFLTFDKNETGRLLPSILADFCEAIAPQITDDNDTVLSENAVKLMRTLQRDFDGTFLDGQKVDFSFSKLLVFNTLDKLNISRVSSPQGALQVMGLLETRMLDFRNVILVSANEGVLPKGISYDSLLPFDFKYKFDGKEALSNYLYQDQVYAYHFFRLLQRAENVRIIYNSNSDDKLAEVSRFVSQMVYEARANGLDNLKFSHSFSDFDLKMSGYEQVSIPKNEEMMKTMSGLSFSASSLKNYIMCPVKFFFQNVAKIEKPVPLTDDMGANEVGTVIHDIFSEVFDKMKDSAGRHRYEEIINHYIENVSDEIVAAIRKLKGRERITDEQLGQGAWQINRHLIAENVRMYLVKAKDELADPLVEILGNEQKYNATLSFTLPDNPDKDLEISLYGVFDRIQQRGGYVEILDYKTGKVEESKLAVTSPRKSGKCTDGAEEDVFFDRIFKNPDYEKLFQLMFYALLYSKSESRKELPVRVGIISTRKVNQGSDDYILFGNIYGDTNLSEYIAQFEDGLRVVLSEIFNKGVPFTCTDKPDNCKYCDYSVICRRKVVQ